MKNFEESDIHPRLWGQLSPTQQYSIMRNNKCEIHQKEGAYFAARANIITSPPCITPEEARGYDDVSLTKLEELSNEYEQQPKWSFDEK